MEKLYSLQYGLSIILIFIGVKMIFEKQFDQVGFTNVHNMVVLVGIIVISVLFAFIFPRPEVEKSSNKK
jgi:tellurite resistance protein TerC